VVLTARDSALLSRAVSEIEAAGGVAAAIACDLRPVSSAALVTSFALDRFGRIDILVNNAGATKRGRFPELSEEDWVDGFALKFLGAVRLTRAAWPALRKTRGSLVNISGIGGRTPGAEFAVGGSVNAALLSFTKALAELGVIDGVQVNAVNPGTIRTDRFKKRLEALARTNELDLAEAERRFIESERITRIGEPEDIAALVAYIISEAGRFLHGALIDMDGGATKTI
jgi:NAD(P)-dependent dehydrogenase (short-subunit alcohol dehydrogenase family)